MIDTGGPALGLDQRFTWLDFCAMYAMQIILGLPGRFNSYEELTEWRNVKVPKISYEIAKGMIAEKRRLEGE